MVETTSSVVACPHCAKPVPWTPASEYKPFCSERCRLIDLGAWLAEEHVIPGEDAIIPRPDESDSH